MVALGLMELGLLGVGLRLLLLGSVEDATSDREHGDDGEDLLGALEVDRSDEHLGEWRFDGQIGHLPAETSEETFLVERREGVKVLQRRDHRLLWWRIHKVEVEEIVDAHRLEHEDRVGKVLALDVGDGVGQHLVAVGRLGVQAVALAGPCSTSTSRALTSLSLRDGGDDEGVHSEARVVGVLLDEAGVDDVVDPVDREGRLGDVGGENDLASARRSGLEDLGLHLGGEGRVDG